MMTGSQSVAQEGQQAFMAHVYSTEITRHLNINMSSAQPGKDELAYLRRFEAQVHNNKKRAEEAKEKADDAKKKTEEDNKAKEEKATETSKASSSGGT
ncbi:uncharacterized protein J4E79_001065 [Alternaria viburni]|uniref:uncharacterized protein n=1 Tax=Alternaria viburni TaxID=566460 RepID=UPI0020C4C8A2|nr:uncharacterized protein J4E79_001065 [Alternaria viburni]KAI4669023.1 hypothetical protein J4E79_001065 [Alternaria viburni]